MSSRGEPTRKHAYIGNEELAGRDLNPLLGEAKDAPTIHVVREDRGQNRLQEGMLEFAQVTLHDHAVVILAVGLVAGGEVLLHGV